jgi:Mg/Co/Ni transporter MgtE
MDSIKNKDNLKIILDDSSNLSLNQIRDLLSKMSSSEIAHALESSPPKQRNLL